MTAALIGLGLCLAVGLAVYGLWVMQRMADGFARALVQMVSVQATGMPSIEPASVIPAPRPPEDRLLDEMADDARAFNASTVAAGVTALRGMYRDQGRQVPNDADLRAEVALLLNGQAPGATS